MAKTTKFKQTDIGPIPEDWDVKQLDSCAALITKGTTPTSIGCSFTNDGVNFIKAESISDDGVFIKNMFAHIDEHCDRLLMRSRLNANDILFSIAGVLGRVAIVCDDILPANTNQALAIIRLCKTSFILPRFLIYAFKDNRFVSHIESINVAAAQANLSLAQVSEFLIPTPSLPEQRRIAETLGDVDALISSLDQLIKKKKAIKIGAMQELLTGNRRLPGFSGKWVEKRLGDILDYEQPQKYIVKNDIYVDHGVPVLTPGKTFILGFTSEQFGVCTSLPIILFDDFLTINRYIDFNFKVKSSAVKLLRPKNSKDDLYFVSQAMSRIKFTPGDHQRHWIGIYSNFTLMMPSPEEQKAISNVLRDMDNEITSLDSELFKMQKIKQGMMQELLSGRIRLEVA